MKDFANLKPTTADPPLPGVVQQAQLQLALHALTQEHRNLLIRFPNTALAHTVADWLPAQLVRWWPQAQVLQCSAHEGHRLFEAFNTLLQSQPQGVTHSDMAHAAVQIWLVHDKAFNRPEDLNLLVRMLLTFEHLPLRVVLLMPPGTALPASSAEMARLHLLELDEPDRASAPQSAAALPPATPVCKAEFDQVAPARQEKVSAAPATVQATPWKLPAGVALATVLIGGLAWWSQQIDEPGALIASRTPTADAAKDSASTGVTQESATVVYHPALPGATGSSASSPTAQTAPDTTAEDSATDAARQNTQPAGTQGSRASATAGTAPVTGLREARQWLDKLPAESWLVEHSRHSSWRQARRSTGTQLHLREARILPVKDKAQTQYLVVTGPFRSVERAGNYQQRLKLQGRTHKTSHLRRQLAS